MKLEDCKVGMKVKALFSMNEDFGKIGTISAIGRENLFVVFPHKNYSEGMELHIYPAQVEEYIEDEEASHVYEMLFTCRDGASVEGCLLIDGTHIDTAISTPATCSDDNMMEAFTASMAALLTKLATKNN